MILTKEKILEEIKNKRIKITPYNAKNLGPASYDLTLSTQFRMFKGNENIRLDENTDYKKYTKLVNGKITLKPGEFILGITEEKITLPSEVCGWLTGRSRFARLGLQIHSTAAFLQPGIDNRQVLEIYNLSSDILQLKPGLKICQIVFERTDGKARYKGKFAKQKL
jgi:dCTP deaminase